MPSDVYELMGPTCSGGGPLMLEALVSWKALRCKIYTKRTHRVEGEGECTHALPSLVS